MWFSLMLLLLMASTAVMAQEEYNFLKQGYSFFDTIIGGYGGAVGKLEPLQTQNPPFDFDFVTYEVTWACQNMQITEYQVIGDVYQWAMTGGTIGIWEDPDFDLDYGVSPATGIATATDGNLALGGYIISSVFLYNDFFQTGSFSGLCHWNDGSRLGELGDLALEDWSIFDGASTDVSVSVPPGYHSRFAGRIYTMGETPVQESSWSQIRALY
jgi:hypothetical protein